MKKLLFACFALIASMGLAFAQVDVNKADAAALDSVKGIGPKMTQAILTERGKGEFKDWNDLQTRVKGVGEKNAAKLSAAGLTVSGKAKDGAPMGSAPAASSKSAPKKGADKAAAPAHM